MIHSVIWFQFWSLSWPLPLVGLNRVTFVISHQVYYDISVILTLQSLHVAKWLQELLDCKRPHSLEQGIYWKSYRKYSCDLNMPLMPIWSQICRRWSRGPEESWTLRFFSHRGSRPHDERKPFWWNKILHKFYFVFMWGRNNKIIFYFMCVFEK